MHDTRRREGLSEMMQKLLETLTPAERLAGLSPEEQILALSDEVLRGFSDDHVRSLPEHVQQKIRERLAAPR
jgi:hypothetical protein